MLVSMLVLPGYVLDLQAAAAGGAQEAERAATEASSVDVSNVLVHPRTAGESVPPAAAAAVACPATHESPIPPAASQCHNHTLQAKMEAVMNYERAKPFELLCSLAYMSGRSMAELLCTGDFTEGQVELTHLMQQCRAVQAQVHSA